MPRLRTMPTDIHTYHNKGIITSVSWQSSVATRSPVIWVWGDQLETGGVFGKPVWNYYICAFLIVDAVGAEIAHFTEVLCLEKAEAVVTSTWRNPKLEWTALWSCRGMDPIVIVLWKVDRKLAKSELKRGFIHFTRVWLLIGIKQIIWITCCQNQ